MKQRTRKSNTENSGESLIITRDNLGTLCKERGFRSVAEMARQMGRNDKTLWCAVRWPERYYPTMKLLRFWLTKRRGGAR
jgi:hypothetical protein